VAAVSAGSTPKLLASGVDLLVEPVWSADSRHLVYRRSTAAGQVLAIKPLDGGEERVIASSETSALFPVALTGATNDGVYYVAIDESAGSRLFAVDLASGVSSFAGALSLGLTRDWSLSPDGTRLAYLEIGAGPDDVASRALVFDIATARAEHVTSNTTAAFGPVWTAKNELIVGSLDEAGHTAGLIKIGAGRREPIEGPSSGFEVPVAASPSDTGVVVRAFERASSYSPGRSSLALVGADGARQTISTGEVTFVGWTNP
jgi:Tol biopolymer transport system component